MGLFEKIFPPRAARKEADAFFKTLTAYQPAFTNWGGAIYESELVRAAIDARARHISKLEIEFTGAAKPYMQSRLKSGPNEWQTWSQVLYRISTILDCCNNCFIVPIYGDSGEITGIYPVLPERCDIVQCNGNPYLRYRFSGGQTAALPLNECGILTKFQFKDDFFGETNRALTPTMQLIDINNQGITEGIKSSATYRFMANLSNFTKPEDLVKERKRFSKENFEGEDGGGILLFPNTYNNVKQIESKPFVISDEQMSIINKNVYNYFGVNEEILQNKAADELMDSFFNGAIEPLSIQLSDVLTKMLFTPRERAAGNKALATANRLQYMSFTHKINMATQLGDRGMIFIDEIRALFNYPPLPNGAGQHAPIRGEYYMQGEEEPANGDT